MTDKLRILNVVVQPQLVIDNGEELIPGPQLAPVTLSVSQLSDFIAQLPHEVSELQKQLDAEKASEVKESGTFTGDVY